MPATFALVRACVLAVGVLVALAPVARADDADRAMANALFEDARRLEAEGRTLEACERYAASVALLRRLGALLNMANCYQTVGKIATAWTAFGEAVALADRSADPREDFARARADALAPRVMRLVVTVAPGNPDSLALQRDGIRLPAALHGVPVAVDPGEHIVEASAPGRVPWMSRVELREEGKVVVIEAPVLAVAPPTPILKSAPRPTPAPPVARPGRARRVAIWAAGAVGVTGVGVGTYAGISAWRLWDRALPACGDDLRCSGDDYREAVRARRLGYASTAAFAVAGVAAVTGLVLHWTRPTRAEVLPLRIAPELRADGAALHIEGAF